MRLPKTRISKQDMIKLLLATIVFIVSIVIITQIVTTTTLHAPKNLNANIDGNTINISWSNDNNKDVSYYEIYINQDEPDRTRKSILWTEVFDNDGYLISKFETQCPINACTLKNIKPNYKYDIKVRAVTETQDSEMGIIRELSEWSDLSIEKIERTQPTKSGETKL